jgi:alkylation response protein AidB-like acyl-CoA dehydrogenase
MHFEMTAAQQEARARATVFVEEVCRPLEDRWPYDDYDMDPDVVMDVARKFREYGLRALSVPRDAGGLGTGTLAKCLVYEEIESSHVVHGALATWAGLMEPHPALYSAPRWQQEKYLHPLLEEDKFFHLHISEPDTGSDAAASRPPQSAGETNTSSTGPSAGRLHRVIQR